jgi:hypothetical protein
MAGSAIATGAPIAAMYNVKPDPMYGQIPSNIVGSADFNVSRGNYVNPSYSPDVENFHQWLRGEQAKPSSADLDRSENVPFSAISNAYLDRNSPSELNAYPHQVKGPQQFTRASTGIGSDAVNSARQIAASRANAPVGGKGAPQPPPRPAELQGKGDGFLSGLFTNRPASTRELFQRSIDNPDDPGAWMRAERQYAATHKENPNFDVNKLNESGMARGGAAPTKEALLHKSLEIIHHMVRNR